MNVEEFEKTEEIYEMSSENVSDNEVSATKIVKKSTSADQSGNKNKSEAVLYDVLDHVFNYLNVRDLAHAARVSKSWRDAAKRELSSRGPETLILQYAYNYKDDANYSVQDGDEIREIQLDENATHISNFIRTNPRICISFTDNCEYPEQPDVQICRRFADEFSYESSIIVIETLGVSIDESEILADYDLTASLLLPSTQMVNVEVIRQEPYSLEENDKNEEYTHRILDKLLPREQEHTCIIMFHQYLDKDQRANQGGPCVLKFHSDVLCNLKKRRKLCNYNLWGGSITSTTASLKNLVTHATVWIGISISGPTLRSWTINLDRNLPNCYVEEKLLTLKKDVDLKSDSVALMLVPSNKKITRAEKLSRIITFKKIFPSVRLLTLFNNQKLPVFSVNSNSTETDQEISHMNSVAYLILSYGKSHLR